MDPQEIRLIERLESCVIRLESLDQRVESLEERVPELEKLHWKAAGFLACLGVIWGLVSKFL